MRCQLCFEDKPLLKKSHIIPSFMYKGLWGTKHRLIAVNLSNPKEHKKMRTGYYDSDILCAKCDNEVLGKLESYVNDNIYQPHPKRSTSIASWLPGNQTELPCLRIANLDYHLVKLFYLSILWRSHLSKQPFFDTIRLTHEDAEQIRQMILTGDAGSEDRYEVVILDILTDEPRPTKAIFDPMKMETAAEEYYVFHINELMYHFNIRGKEDIFDRKGIRKDCILDIPVMTGRIATEYFDSYVGKPIPVKNSSGSWKRLA